MGFKDTIANIGQALKGEREADENLDALDFLSSFINQAKGVGKSIAKFTEVPQDERTTISKGGVPLIETTKFGGVAAPGGKVIDPLNVLSTGVSKSLAKILRTAQEKGVSKEGIKRILTLADKDISPIKMFDRKGKPTKAFGSIGEPTEQMRSFLKAEDSTREIEALVRDEKLFKGQPGADKIIKVKQKGNGQLVVRQGELDTMKKMLDLKPTRTERLFQNPIRVFEEMGSDAKELFFRPIKVAEKEAVMSKNFWNDRLAQVTKGLNKKSSEKIMRFALSKEDDGRRILQQLGKKADPLNDKELAAFKFMRFRYNTMINQLNEARAFVGKEPIKKRENYFTHIRNLNILEDMGFTPVTDDVEALISNNVHRNSTPFQFAKKRKGTKEIELDAFNVFNKYQESAINHIKLTPAIGKVRELTRNQIPDPKTGQPFKFGEKSPVAAKYITEWLDFVAGQKVPTIIPQIAENLLRTVNQNQTFAILAGNIRSALIQPAAIVNTVTEIGPKHTASGIKQLIGGKGKFALENSNVLSGRQFDSNVKDVTDSVFQKGSSVKKELGRKLLTPLQILDGLTAQATWLGAFERAKTELGMSAKKASNFADDTVTKTQASAAKSDVAKVQRTTGGKVATLFQTFVINDFNRIFKDVLGFNTKMSKSEKVKKTATMLAGVTMYNVLMEDVLGIPTPFPRPIKETLQEESLAEGAKELIGQVPIVGGSVRFGSSIGGPILDLVDKTVKKVNGKYTNASWLEIAGKVFGVPGTNQLKKTFRTIEGLEDGWEVTVLKRNKDGDIINSKTTGKPKLKRLKIKADSTVDTIRGLLLGVFETKAVKEAQETGRANNK